MYDSKKKRLGVKMIKHIKLVLIKGGRKSQRTRSRKVGHVLG